MGTSDITVTALIPSPGIGHILLKAMVVDPRDGAVPQIALDTVEFYASASNDFSLATKIDEGKDKGNHSALVEGATYYYWAIARNRSGSLGARYPASATAGVPATVAFASDFTLINGQIVATAAAGALTIALKTLDGSDPSASNPVRVPFRKTDYAAASVESIIAPLSLTISSGSTLGVNAGSVRFKVHVTAIKKSTDGTVHLGAVNCVSNTPATRIFALSDIVLAGMPTVEGGAGGADSAGVIYAAAAVGGSMRVLGFLSYGDSGLATPGTWVAPDYVQLAGPSIALPGEEIQSAAVCESALSTLTFGGGGITSLPYDNTVPEAAEYGTVTTVTIIPTHGANVNEVEIDVSVSPPAANEKLALILSNGGTIVLALAVENSDGADIPKRMRLSTMFRATAGSSLVLHLAIGYTGTGVVTINGVAGASKFGGTAMKSTMKVTERAG